MKNSEYVQVPYLIYQNLLNHLQVHAAADGWAAQLVFVVVDANRF
jgi:hypothetical protein